MEEDKKKKKSKKKKNKQNKTTTDNSLDGHGPGALVSPGKSIITAPVDAVPPDAQHDTVSTVDVDPESHHLPGSTLPESEKQHRPERDATFEEKIKQFQEEKDAHEHKEAVLEEKIQKLLLEKDVSLQKEATLLEKIEELQNDKAAHIQKEDRLEEQILQLQKENDAYMQKVNALENKIAQMQMEKEAHMQKESDLKVKFGQLLSEKESWFHKEARFEEKINHLVDEAATLSLKKVSLEEMVKQMERERDLWLLQEDSSQDVIARLNDDNSRLKSQVVELEELRNSLLQENHLLRENISGLQSQILNLERTAVVPQSSNDSKMHTAENGDVASQTEAAHVPVDRLIAENAQLVEKVNELYVELDHRGLQQETYSADSSAGMSEYLHVADSTAIRLHPIVGVSEMPERAPASDSINKPKMFVPGTRVQSQEDDVNNDLRSDGDQLDGKNSLLPSDSSEIIKSDEIVQIPLDENENELTGLEPANNAEKTEIPLSDAPLIGAPFRLISFVARYVSGADLVEKNAVNSGR